MIHRPATAAEMVEFVEKRNHRLSYKHATLEYMVGDRVAHRSNSSAKPFVKGGKVYVIRHGQPEAIKADHYTLESGTTFLAMWRAEYL